MGKIVIKKLNRIFHFTFDQPNDRPSNRPTNQTMDQLPDQPTDQQIKRTTNRTTKGPSNSLTGQPYNWAMDQLTG